MRRVSSIDTSNAQKLIPVTASREPQQPTIVTFVPDIQKMMFGLGDCLSPLDSTAILIEEIVLNQMMKIIAHAEDVAKLHGKTTIQPEDICFLMKKNLPALKRLITYLGLMEKRGSLTKIARYSSESSSAIASIPLLDPSELVIDDRPSPENVLWEKGRQKYCLKFLNKLGISRAALNFVDDPVKQKRNMRAEARALISTQSAYEMYHASRCASFCRADLRCSKFSEWLETRGHLKDKLDTSVLEILVYLAKETVACLIDMVLTLREEDSLRKNAISTQAITPDEIREVIRRFRFQFNFNCNVMSRDVPPTVSSTHFIAF